MVVFALIQNNLPWSLPPGPIVRLSQYLGKNDISTSSESLYPELRTRVYHEANNVLFEIVKKSIKELGWEVVSEDRDRSTVHAVVTTSLFRFKDDVKIIINGNDESGYTVNVHSASRVGKGDLGTNTRHIIDLYSALDKLVINRQLKQEK